MEMKNFGTANREAEAGVACLTVVIAAGLTLLVGCSSGIQRPAIVTRHQWRALATDMSAVAMQTPTCITIHHGGVTWKMGTDPAAFVRALQKWSINKRRWADVPYHFMIAPDGQIFEGRAVEYVPASNTKYDVNGNIAVEVMGNFEIERVNQAQLQSLVKLLAWLCQTYHISPTAIAGHRDRAPGQTVCPGKDLYRYLADGLVQRWTKQTMAGQEAQVKVQKPGLNNDDKQ